MLLFVQIIQIARAQTTFESMQGRMPNSIASEAITATLTSGTTSMSGAQVGPSGLGPNPALGRERSQARAKGVGCFSQWVKLLGLDTFMVTAKGGIKTRQRGNPYSRGLVTNCKDFWCDPAPYFGRRENGAAMLDGDVINYTKIYEAPPRMKLNRSLQEGGGGTMYHSVSNEEAA